MCRRTFFCKTLKVITYNLSKHISLQCQAFHCICSFILASNFQLAGLRKTLRNFWTLYCWIQHLEWIQSWTFKINDNDQFIPFMNMETETGTPQETNTGTKLLSHISKDGISTHRMPWKLSFGWEQKAPLLPLSIKIKSLSDISAAL